MPWREILKVFHRLKLKEIIMEAIILKRILNHICDKTLKQRNFRQNEIFFYINYIDCALIYIYIYIFFLFLTFSFVGRKRIDLIFGIRTISNVFLQKVLKCEQKKTKNVITKRRADCSSVKVIIN